MVSGSDDKEHTPAPEAAKDESAPIALEKEAQRRRRVRSLAIAWALFALALLFFLVTIIRLGSNVANRPL
jgi:hypothetical protein